MTTSRVSIELDPGAFGAALPILLSIYAAAMNYPPATAQARAPLWLNHSQRSGFRCVVAMADGNTHGATQTPTLCTESDTIAAFAYGYRGAAGQWWHNEVARGLGSHSPPQLADYFELTELHVRPMFQGRGLGEMLLRHLVSPVAASRVMLSTPEGDNRAWRLYRRLGFTDVLRDFLFTGDARPFAVLGGPLPLDAPAGTTSYPRPPTG